MSSEIEIPTKAIKVVEGYYKRKLKFLLFITIAVQFIVCISIYFIGFFLQASTLGIILLLFMTSIGFSSFLLYINEKRSHRDKIEKLKSRGIPSPLPSKATYARPNKKLLFFAGFLFSLNDRETALGDLEEKFGGTCQKYGKFYANSWLCWDVISSIFSKISPAFSYLLKFAGITSLIALLSQIKTIYDLFFKN